MPQAPFQLSSLVDVTRGAMIECRHTGAIAVSDPKGHLVFAVGDVEQPVFPRSAIKALQAIPLLESGAAAAYGLSPAELALACSSHNGEAGHIETAASVLAKSGLDETALECGAHWPKRLPDQKTLILDGREPGALYNNCSGKHAGFLCLSRHLGADVSGYVKPDHRVQNEIRACLEDLTGVVHAEAVCGTDGCSIPTYAVPLSAMAKAFAMFGTGQGLSADRASAAASLRSACAQHPFHVAGTERFCTDIMSHFRERVFLKTGAEGVFCATFPEQGLGIALKCADGATRASEVMLAHIIATFLPLMADDRVFLQRFLDVPLMNWNRLVVGTVKASEDYLLALKQAGKTSA